MDTVFLPFINQSNLPLNIQKISEFINSDNTYSYGIAIALVLLSIFNAIRSDGTPHHFSLFMLAYLFMIFLEPIRILMNIEIFIFVGEIILILSFSTLVMFLILISETFLFQRTDEEIMDSGFDEVPNTIKRIRLGYIWFCVVLLSTVIYVNFLLLEPVNIKIFWLLSVVGLLGFSRIAFISANLLKMRRHLKDKGYDDEFLKIRGKSMDISTMMRAFDQHEYRYSMLGLTCPPSPHIKQSELFEIASKAGFGEKIDSDEFEKIVMHNKSIINDRNGHGWAPFSICVANASSPWETSTSKIKDRRNIFRVLSILLHNGANININNYMMMSPLNFAIKYGDLEMVKFLVENNADIKKKEGTLGIPSLKYAHNDHMEQALELRQIEIYGYLKNHLQK